MKNYREEAGPSTRAPTALVQSKNEDIPPQQQQPPPQTVQVQYVDQDGRIVHLIQQPYMQSSDGSAVYVNGPPPVNENTYENS
jgi:hypothetical protein